MFRGFLTGSTHPRCRIDTGNDDTASITLEYTRPVFRRHHYAQNMVYEATNLVIAAGNLPMLYTDANYEASNACCRKIGYRLRGVLATVGVKYEL